MSIREQVNEFLVKCDELKSCKFIVAPTKIKDLLKSIVNGPDLYKLFSLATIDFNYPEMHRKCLLSPYEARGKDRIILPRDDVDKIAFIFCLLVDFDSNETAFNDFLQQYFPESDSFAASYRSFCTIIIDGLSQAVLRIIAEDIKDEEHAELKAAGKAEKAELFTVISLSISKEIQFLNDTKKVPEKEKEGGRRILNRLAEAVKAENKDLIDALICGYNYFVLYYNCVSDGLGSLIKSIAEFEEVL